MTSEKTDITSEIEKMSSDAAVEQSKAGRQRGKFQMPILNIFLWGWFFLSLLLLMVIAWNYLQEQVYSQGLRTGAQNTLSLIHI